MPDEFECSDPFGVETLQINAQTIQFPPISIVTQDGYTFIKDNLEEVLIGSRGFKRVASGDALEKADKRLMFKTMLK